MDNEKEESTVGWAVNPVQHCNVPRRRMPIGRFGDYGQPVSCMGSDSYAVAHVVYRGKCRDRRSEAAAIVCPAASQDASGTAHGHLPR